MNKMFEYPMEKYKFYFAPNKVVAVSTYEGKIVRGVAKCDPRDEFNIDLGKQLAAARCNQKIARKRANRAEKRYNDAIAAVGKAESRVAAMNDYVHDAWDAARAADNAVDDLLGKI